MRVRTRSRAPHVVSLNGGWEKGVGLQEVVAVQRALNRRGTDMLAERGAPSSAVPMRGQFGKYLPACGEVAQSQSHFQQVQSERLSAPLSGQRLGVPRASVFAALLKKGTGERGALFTGRRPKGQLVPLSLRAMPQAQSGPILQPHVQQSYVQSPQSQNTQNQVPAFCAHVFGFLKTGRGKCFEERREGEEGFSAGHTGLGEQKAPFALQYWRQAGGRLGVSGRSQTWKNVPEEWGLFKSGEAAAPGPDRTAPTGKQSGRPLLGVGT